jgi:hypothetical protein
MVVIRVVIRVVTVPPARHRFHPQHACSGVCRDSLLTHLLRRGSTGRLQGERTASENQEKKIRNRCVLFKTSPLETSLKTSPRPLAPAQNLPARSLSALSQPVSRGTDARSRQPGTRVPCAATPRRPSKWLAGAVRGSATPTLCSATPGAPDFVQAIHRRAFRRIPSLTSGLARKLSRGGVGGGLPSWVCVGSVHGQCLPRIFVHACWGYSS